MKVNFKALKEGSKDKLDTDLFQELLQFLYKNTDVKLLKLRTLSDFTEIDNIKIETSDKVQLIPICIKSHWCLLYVGIDNKKILFSYLKIPKDIKLKLDEVIQPDNDPTDDYNSGFVVLELICRFNEGQQFDQVKKEFDDIDEATCTFLKRELSRDVFLMKDNSLRIYNQDIQCAPITIKNTTALFSEKNEVELLLDGEDFFGEFNKQMNCIINGSFDKKSTYVRLACWEAELGLLMEGPEGDNKITLQSQLEAIAKKGITIDVILWQPDFVARRFMPVDNTGFQQALKDVQNINVYLEYMKGWGFGFSTHQKMAIFSMNGKLTVLTGGLNFSNWYWDEKAHSMKSKFRNVGDGGSNHDTGISIVGPGTLDIEQEWVRRYIKVSKKKLWDIRRGRLITQVISSPQKAVTIVSACTNGALRNKVKDIKYILLNQVKNAKSSLYFEGFTFSDPELVKAIADRLKGDSPPSVKILIPPQILSYPTAGVPYFLGISMLKIGFFACTSITIKNIEYKRKDHEKWEIDFKLNSNWQDEDTIIIKKPNEKEKKFKIGEVEAMDDVDLFCKPVYKEKNKQDKDIYIHSKLGVIDDKVLLIGSCNFNYRSLNVDNELSCFITGNDTRVKELKKKLDDHFDTFDNNSGTKIVTFDLNKELGRNNVKICDWLKGKWDLIEYRKFHDYKKY